MNLFKFYLSKFTWKNFKKAVRFIFTGELRHLLMILKLRWVYIKSKKQKNADIADWVVKNIIKRPDHSNHDIRPDFQITGYDDAIDIIIPIYNGIEYFEALFNSLSHTNMKYNVFAIDDCSPDSRVNDYLTELAKLDSRITVIRNDKNMGFVQSVNKAFGCTKNHVALLNTDIVLPPYWLERLMYPIINMEKTASSTPFTNCGTLCSFPKIGDDNPLFESLSCDEIDLAFAYIKPAYTELPTGVGFCMGINKDALKMIGHFDAETFSKGYGEENDWCQRAIKAGYKNVMIENLFVYHKHSGSFSSEEKKKLIEKNSKLLLNKHPRYDAEVAAFFNKDPLKQTREFVIMHILNLYKAKKRILVFDHNIGGGATEFLEAKLCRGITSGDCVITIRYDEIRWFYQFIFRYKEYEFKYKIEEINDLNYILNHLRCDEVIVNELVTYPKIYILLSFIMKLAHEHNMKMVMYIHDYHCVCPMVNLLTNKHVYCGLLCEDMCNGCFNWREDDNEYGEIKIWRKNWGAFLLLCNEVIVFSNDTRKILEKVYGAMSNIIVSPHQVDYMIKPGKMYKTTDTINIGLIGVLTFHKGLRIITDMLKIIKQGKLNVRIILIGSSNKQLKHKNFYETGRYKKESLPLLSMQHDIDVFFISSIIPETFSYTTEETIKMGIPVAIFDLGAPAERAAMYDKGLIIDSIDAQTALDQIVDFVSNKVKKPENPYYNTCILFVGEYISFSSRYRVEHFREQLLVQGVRSDYIDIKNCEKVDFDKYEAVVIYRCRHTAKVEAMIESFNKNGKKIYYDIDDYTFEYDQIKDLKFLSDEEYRDFKVYTEGIKKCMSLCDGYITSTNNMKQVIKLAFPNSPTIVNRNVASMEMVSLSASAGNKVMKSADRVIMGYFSGSKTHDGDFEIISDIIISLFEKYDNLYLMIIGCLNLVDEFEAYKNRLIMSEFVDWRKLPDLIASVDINLMPVENTLFHRCKSENKWMEAALVAVPTVCSYNNELEHVIKDGVTGFLCRNADEWIHTLSRLIQEPDLRNTVGNAANSVVFERHITTVTGKPAKDFINTGKERDAFEKDFCDSKCKK